MQNKKDIIFKENLKQLIIELKSYIDFQYWARGFYVLDKPTVATLLEKATLLKLDFSKRLINNKSIPSTEIGRLLTTIVRELDDHHSDYKDKTACFELTCYGAIRKEIEALSYLTKNFLGVHNIDWITIEQINESKGDFNLIEEVKKLFSAENNILENFHLPSSKVKKEASFPSLRKMLKIFFPQKASVA